jgi:tetraacyldisaccharide 4'-kinase
MRFPWLEKREESVALRVALLPLELAALVYGAGAAVHRGLYRRGWRRARRLPCRVVSVGGIVAGGSGKTPLAAWVALTLRQRGHRVALLSRGYGRRRDEPVVIVSDGKHLHSTPELAGDEPFLLASHVPDVPVLVADDRGVAGLRAIAAFGAEVVVLDDGFQHHRLARDVEIVAIDGGLGLGNGRVLPRGPLREPRGALRRADAVVVIDGPLPAAEEAHLQRLTPGAERLVARRRPVGWRPLGGGALAPATDLAGLRVGLLAGIARPASLRRSVEALGARVVAERFFRDHHAWRSQDVRDLEPGVSTWITTEKDAVKMVAAWTGGADVRVLSIELEVETADAFANWLEQRLRGAPRAPHAPR